MNVRDVVSSFYQYTAEVPIKCLCKLNIFYNNSGHLEFSLYFQFEQNGCKTCE